MDRGSIDPAYKWQTAAELRDGNLCNSSVKWLDFVSYCHELEPDENILIFRMKTTDQEFIDMTKKMEKRLVEFEKVVQDNLEMSRWV